MWPASGKVGEPPQKAVPAQPRQEKSRSLAALGMTIKDGEPSMALRIVPILAAYSVQFPSHCDADFEAPAEARRLISSMERSSMWVAMYQ
jgi:hypothetical protein